jgi:hypothetical protein
MRTLLCLALLSTALASATLPAAASAANATSISRGDAEELKQDAAGEYRLDNGRRVRLALVEDRLYLDLKRGYRRELVPVAEGVLASHDGRLTVQYMPNGPVEQIFIQHAGLPGGARLGEVSWRGR